MKKSIIAGASVATLGFAALPFADVFAATSAVTDNINITLNPTCSISRTNVVADDSATT